MPITDKKRTSGRPLLLYVVPSLAIFVSLLSVLWGTFDETVVAAQVWGGPTDAPSGFRGRVRLVQEAAGVIAPVASRTFSIDLIQGAHRATRQLESGPEGWAEFSFSRRTESRLELSVHSRGRELARGAPELPTSRWRRAATSLGGPLAWHESGEFRAKVHVELGVLGVPFESKLWIEATFRGRPAAGAGLRLSGESLDLLDELPTRLDEKGLASFRVRPLHHISTLRVAIQPEKSEEPLGSDSPDRTETPDRAELRFEQTLPVIPGSLGMKRSPDGILVQSPVERDSAWFTFVTREQRLGGGRVVLSPRAGGAEGWIPAANIPQGESDLFLVLSTEADGRSPSTVGFPLAGQETTFEAWDGFLLDGLPGVMAERQRRNRRFRLSLGAYAAVAGLLTLILFWFRVHRSDMQLEQNLQDAGAETTTRARSQIPLLVALLCLFLAFSAVVLWIVAR